MQNFLRSWWVPAASITVVLAALSAFVLPTFFPALRSPGFRIAVAVISAAGLAIAIAWRSWRARRASETIAEELADQGAADAEEDSVRARMREALDQLKKIAGSKRDYFYDRPWFVIIGPPGAGKSTAIANSGLRFPWADTAVGGVGGTRNIDFWFADEAVIADTAGRYTTQDSHRAADAAGWEHFLQLLRRARPLEPVNGVIAALGVDELMSADRAALDLHISAMRRRLTEIGQHLQLQVPVYLLLSKADLIAGFAEYFADLNAESRRAVLGATLAPVGVPSVDALLLQFDQVVEALWARSAKRLQDEFDPARRGKILAFPAQVASLRSKLAYFAEGVFRGEGETAPLLRGFYFTSGTQAGMPIDRVLRSMAAVYEAPPAAPQPGKGRAFFLHRALTEVIFPEAGLVRAAPAVRRRRRTATIAMTAAIAVAWLTAAAIWGNSFARNKAFQNALAQQSQIIAQKTQSLGIDLADVKEGDVGLAEALPLLDALGKLPQGFDDQAAGSPPWTMRLGLFQGGHATTARLAYLEALQRIMLPRVLLRAEQVMRENEQRPVELYAPLKAYLMLGGHGRLDPRTVKAWVLDDWSRVSLSGADRADVRRHLARHLDAMLADPDLGRVWQGRRAPLDGGLIAATRISLQKLALADRAYAILRQRAAAMGRPDWRAETVLADGDRAAFRNASAVHAASIPWFYTREGYVGAFRPGLDTIQAQLDRDLWVLGPDAGKQSIRLQLGAVRTALVANYARDYIAAWDGMIASPQAADYFENASALGAITRNPSPIKLLLLEASRNTRFTKGAALPPAGEADAAATIERHFKGVRDFAGTEKSVDAPLDILLKALRQAAIANSASKVPGAALAGGAVQAQFATALGELSTAAVVAPPQLQSFVAQATQSGEGAAAGLAQETLQREYATNLLGACEQSTRRRYPFAQSASLDASPVDLLRFYGANGQLDLFVRDRLRGFLDTSQPQWRWKQDDPVVAGFVAASAAELQKSEQIRDILAGGLTFDISAESLGSDIGAVEFSSGGTTHRFDAESPDPRPILWNLSLLPLAHVTIFAAAQPPRRIEARGPFALFRLLDKATVESAGNSRLRVMFGEGSQRVALLLVSPDTDAPFDHRRAFSFSCPANL